MAANPNGHPNPNGPDPRVIIPAVSAAAHCAQSCLRFWNLLLQDAASVNPFGMSTDGCDHEDEEEEEEEQPDEERDPSPSPLPQPCKIEVKEEEEELPPEGPAIPFSEDMIMIPPSESDVTAIPRPESYMRARTLHWWNYHVGFAREDDPKYTHVFRLPIGFFTTVCALCREDIQQGDIPMSLRNVEGRIMSVERQVAIAVMRLSTGNTLKSISELLGCGRSTIVKIVNKVITSVRLKAASHLQWPSTSERIAEVKEGFHSKYGLLNCCGAVALAHIVIELPTGEPTDVWTDRNHNFSMVIQAVVDTELRILDICVGHPGSFDEAKCLRESAFYTKCCTGERLRSEPVQTGEGPIGEYVVGQPEHPLLPWLMKPYKPSELTPVRALYNEKLHLTRVVLARAFGRLKGSWRILHGTMKQPNIERMPKMIHAICIMHNMCVDAGGVEGVIFPEADVVGQFDTEGPAGFEEEELDEARQTRDVLCSYINMLEQQILLSQSSKALSQQNAAKNVHKVEE